MRISNILLRILWERPDPEGPALASSFEAITHQYIVPRYERGLKLIGQDPVGAGVTLFIRPDGFVHSDPASTIGTLFDVAAASAGVDMIDADTLSAWVFVDGEVRATGRHTSEEWDLMKRGTVLYSDNPDYVLILNWLRFLSPEAIDDLESHLGQAPV